jgi:arylsulfatase A-like enzyme
MRADADGMRHLGLAPDSIIGARVAECGFDVFERDDGMKPEGPDGSYDPDGAKAYNAHLRDKGYDTDNPWHDHANSGIDAEGNVLSGWFLKNSTEPANIAEEDSETPYLTGRGIDFMAQATAPWLCHLSYIKPHWPYIVPSPYAEMFGPEHVLPANRSEAERVNPHPVYRAFMDTRVGQAFSREDVRETVARAYMGLIKQIDDQMGRLFAWMEETGRMNDTMIVLTSDHGDFLGDHWMGEKTFFQDASTRVPLIIYDPSPHADATRGTVCDALVESLDLAPTFVETAGGVVPDHVLEGRSLVPILHGQTTETGRAFVISEYDYGLSPVAEALGHAADRATMVMVATRDWKLIHFNSDPRPMLFDLRADPEERVDLGTSNAHRDVLDMLYGYLRDWALRPSQRTTISAETAEKLRRRPPKLGVLIGVNDETDVPADQSVRYRGRKARPYQQIRRDASDA